MDGVCEIRPGSMFAAVCGSPLSTDVWLVWTPAVHNSNRPTVPDLATTGHCLSFVLEDADGHCFAPVAAPSQLPVSRFHSHQFQPAHSRALYLRASIDFYHLCSYIVVAVVVGRDGFEFRLYSRPAEPRLVWPQNPINLRH